MDKSLFVMILFLSVGLSASAQQPGDGRRNFDPAQLAERTTRSMIEQLRLSEAQAEKILEVNLKYARRIDSLRNAQQGSFETMREQMNILRSRQAEEQKAYLTGEQFQKWQKYLEERRSNRVQRRKPGKEDEGSGPEH